MVTDLYRPTICVVSPNKDAYTESFIRAHIEGLPAQVKVLYGGYFPTYKNDGKLLLPPEPDLTLRRHLKQAILWRLKKPSWTDPAQMALEKYLLENQIEAVLAEYGPTGTAIMEACKAAGVPLIVHFFGYDAYQIQVLEQEKERYPKLFEYASAIIAASHPMEGQLSQLGAPKEKIYSNPCGADISLFQVTNPSQAPPLFVAVGRFVEKKAPYLTVLAFEKVLKAVSEARLIMIGDGPLWETCKQLARALKIMDAVHFPGPCSHNELTSTLQRARAFVQHSMRASNGDSEGLPVAILEAGATGLPVVATRHAGIQDAVLHNQTGFLVAEGDVDGMAEYMIRLAKDPVLAARLGQAAREHIATEFSLEKSINNLWRIIKIAIEKQH